MTASEVPEKTLKGECSSAGGGKDSGIGLELRGFPLSGQRSLDSPRYHKSNGGTVR
jgi:hypothetical protein